MAVLLEWLTALLEYFDLTFVPLQITVKYNFDYLNTLNQFLETSETPLDPPLQMVQFYLTMISYSLYISDHGGLHFFTKNIDQKPASQYLHHVMAAISVIDSWGHVFR